MCTFVILEILLANIPIVNITFEKHVTLFTEFEAAYHDKSILEKALQVSNVVKMDTYSRKTRITDTTSDILQ